MKMVTLAVTILVADTAKAEDIDADISNAITRYDEDGMMSPDVEWFETNVTSERPYAKED